MTGFIVPMANPPEGDTARIPASLEWPTEELDDQAWAIVSIVGASARLNRQWVGMCVRDLYVSIWRQSSEPGAQKNVALALEYEPAAWLSVQVALGADELVKALKHAEREGWVTITDGVAYPTQRLAEFVCR